MREVPAFAATASAKATVSFASCTRVALNAPWSTAGDEVSSTSPGDSGVPLPLDFQWFATTRKASASVALARLNACAIGWRAIENDCPGPDLSVSTVEVPTGVTAPGL